MVIGDLVSSYNWQNSNFVWTYFQILKCYIKLLLIQVLLPIPAALRNEYRTDIYIHILHNLGVLNDFLFVMEFWESTFTLEHKHLFCWLISLVWGIAKNARFSKSKVLRIIFVCNLYREMRCFISKDCGVKTCLFFGKCVYGKSYQFTVK